MPSVPYSVLCPDVSSMEKQALAQAAKGVWNVAKAVPKMFSAPRTVFNAGRTAGQVAGAGSGLSNFAARMGLAGMKARNPIAFGAGRLAAGVTGAAPKLKQTLTNIAVPTAAFAGGNMLGTAKGKADGMVEGAAQTLNQQQQSPWQTVMYGLASAMGEGNNALRTGVNSQLRDPNTSQTLRMGLPMILQKIQELQQSAAR